MTTEKQHRDPRRDGGGQRPGSAASARRTAVDRFHDTYPARVAVGLLLAVAAHFAILQTAPALTVRTFDGTSREMEAVDLPPPVKVPPPPEQVVRPAAPKVAEAEVSEDVTIAPTTFEAHPAEKLPPPPEEPGVSRKERPSFIPRDVEPRLTNPEQVHRALLRLYPPALRDAGIGGRVVVWIYVGEDGEVARVRLQKPSDYEAFNDAAKQVARKMEFDPAINQDRPIGVWVSQAIRFDVRETAGT